MIRFTHDGTHDATTTKRAVISLLAMPLLAVAAGGAVALVVTLVLVPFAAGAGRRYDVMDRPDHRKDHAAPVPRTGGVAMAAGLGAGLVTSFSLGAFDSMGASLRLDGPVFLIATLAIFSIGLLEDIVGVSVRWRFGIQVGAAILVVATGHSFETISWPFGEPLEVGFLGAVIAVLWLVGITNAVNLMDGLDGLAGGIAAIIAGSFVIFAAIQGVPSSMAVAACLCGAVVGFLPHNWNPARIFLGDSGSLTVGFILASVALTTSLKSSTLVAILVPILALGVPAIDTVLVMLVRYLERPGHPILRRLAAMFEADRTHLHHMVLAFARHRSVVVTALLLLVAGFCLVAILASLAGSSTMAITMLLVEALAVLLIRETGIRARANALAAANRKALKEELGMSGEEDKERETAATWPQPHRAADEDRATA